MRLGRDRDKIRQGEGVTWIIPGSNMKILGFFFNANREASVIEENWILKVEQIKKTMICWSRRNPSI